MYAVADEVATAVASAWSGVAGSNPTTVRVPSPLYVSGTATSEQSTSGCEVGLPKGPSVAVSYVVTCGSQSVTVEARTTPRLWARASS